MNKEFKKYFDKKIKDNTNKYVVMYKATLIFCIILKDIYQEWGEKLMKN